MDLVVQFFDISIPLIIFTNVGTYCESLDYTLIQTFFTFQAFLHKIGIHHFFILLIINCHQLLIFFEHILLFLFALIKKKISSVKSFSSLFLAPASSHSSDPGLRMTIFSFTLLVKISWKLIYSVSLFCSFSFSLGHKLNDKLPICSGCQTIRWKMERNT